MVAVPGCRVDGPLRPRSLPSCTAAPGTSRTTGLSLEAMAGFELLLGRDQRSAFDVFEHRTERLGEMSEQSVIRHVETVFARTGVS